MLIEVLSEIKPCIQERMIMKCPVCENTNLMMSERQGIEIDYCPQCRGVWLDRGELDKIIERSIVATPAPNVEQKNPVQAQSQTQAYPQHQSQHQPQSYPQQQRHQSSYGHQQQSHNYHKKKKEGFLSELFDFD
jgi:Zn-finger nucleic acid-binding protein